MPAAKPARKIKYVPTMDFTVVGMKRRASLLKTYESWPDDVRAEAAKILRVNDGMTPWQAIIRTKELVDIGVI